MFRFHRRTKAKNVKGVDTWMNVSKTGASVSARKGAVTVNSRGRVSIKTPIKGLSLRFKIF